MSISNKKNILLESGTNEIEIMEFKINDQVFGINVAKVKEIMMAGEVHSMPHSHPSIDGVFKPRDEVITVVNLPHYLGYESSERSVRDLFIITNFNKINIAFRINEVVGIHRISWESIQKPDKTVYTGTDGIATGLATFENRLITILDFEKIVAEISPDTSIQISEIDAMGERKTQNTPILMVEDSALLAKMILDCLHKAGYTNIVQTENGQEAIDYLREIPEEDNLFDHVRLIITDIEMPKMDGHHLTKLVKSDSRLKELPIVIFSSLINEEMYKKGKELGANEQLSKPEIGLLVQVIDELVK